MKIKFLLKELKVEEVAKRLDSNSVYEKIIQIWDQMDHDDKIQFLGNGFWSPGLKKMDHKQTEEFFYEHYINSKTFFRKVLELLALRDLTPDKRALALNWWITYVAIPLLKGRKEPRPFVCLTELAGYDMNGIFHLIENFYQYQRFVPEQFRDIMKIKSDYDLTIIIDQAINEYDDWVSKNKTGKLKAEAEYRKIFEDDEYKIYIPDNEQAACLLGMGTKWCTAALTSKNYYHDYHKEEEGDPLFILISKKDPTEKYQFSFGSKEFKEADDRSVSLRFVEKIFDKYREIFMEFSQAAEDWELIGLMFKS